MCPRRLVVVAVVALNMACSPHVRRSAPSLPAFELTEVSVAQLQDGLTTGRYTARRIVEIYLQRISQIDSAGPRLRSVIELNPGRRCRCCP
jgi:amidase